MPREITEPDWKLFRQLHPVALERFCQQVLSEVSMTVAESCGSSHERYLTLFQLVQRRDKELAEAFNGPQRSTALLQLARVRQHKLLSEEEFSRFSAAGREAVQGLLELWRE